MATQEKAAKASDLLIQSLENEGVRFVFGIPGEENLDVLESIRKSSKIKLIVVRHEQAAGFMAATVGRMTGTVGVCLSTLGPGATNFATSAAFAQLGGFASLMITGQKPTRAPRQGAFQIVDIVTHFAPLTKLSKQVPDGRVMASLTREACRLATEEKPGPCLLEIPEDIARDMVPGGHTFEVHQVRRPVAEDKAIARALEILGSHKRPIILIGAGANRKQTAKMLRAFVDETGIPFATTQMGSGVIDERHPKFMGCAALSSDDYVHLALSAADLIINVGHDVVEKPPFFMEHGDGRTVIHVNYISAEVAPVYFPQLEVIGDIGNTIWRFKEGLKAPEAPKCKWDMTVFNRVKEVLDDRLKQKQDDDSFPMNVSRIIHDIRQALPEDGVVSLDNGFYKVWFARLFPAYGRNTLLLDNALATMGSGLPNALAVKALYPSSPVMAVTGDGGYLMNSPELATAVRYGLDVIVIVLNDNTLGMIEWKQGNMGLEKWGLDLTNPDFVKHAESFGASGHRVQKADDLSQMLKKCVGEKGVHVIEVPFTYQWAAQSLKDVKNEVGEMMVEILKEIGKDVNQMRLCSEEDEEESALSSAHLEAAAAASGGSKKESNQKASQSPAKKEEPEGKATKSSGVFSGMFGSKKDKAAKSTSSEVEKSNESGGGGAPPQGTKFPFYLAGEPKSPNYDLVVDNKSDNKPYYHVAQTGKEEIDQALDAAVKAGPALQAMPAYIRKDILMTVVNEVRARREEFARSLCIENGKPITDARGEVERLVQTFEVAAEEAVRQYGEYTPLDIAPRGKGISGVVRRFPIGVVSMISPFNFPLNLAAHKIAPAIAAGCPWVCKPASRTPIGALMIAEILSRHPDYPKGAFSVLPCNREGADLFTVDDRIKLLSFTGSPGVGWDLKSRAGKKKVVLELGGNAATIVDEAVPDMQSMVNAIAHGGYYQSGQSCVSVQRIIIRKDLYSEFKDKFVKHVKQLKMGAPGDEDTFVGPMISQKEAERVESWIQAAVKSGAKLLCGGKRTGPFVEATVLEQVKKDCKVYHEEVFGPVCVLEQYDSFKDAVKSVNDSRYGLQVGVYTTNLHKANYAHEHCEVGGVGINLPPSMRIDSQPYGGVKDSGIGREGLREAIHDMTEPRIMMTKDAANSELVD